MRKALLPIAVAIGTAIFGSSCFAQTAPSVPVAISLRQDINNDAFVRQRIASNEPLINSYLPQMGTCRPPFDTANSNLTTLVNLQASYTAQQQAGTLTQAQATALNNQMNAVTQVIYNYTNLGYQCVVDYPPQTTDLFSANGVDYKVSGGPSQAIAGAIVTTTNNLPAALKAKIAAAATAGWTFYIMHSPEDFQASSLYNLTGSTDAARQAYFNIVRTEGAFTDGNLHAQVFFNYYYPNPGSPNTYTNFATGSNPTAAVAHENEHLNDWRIGRPSQNDATFNTYYNQGVAAYNAATGHDTDIGANFINGGAAKGKEELFAELGAYWDTSHMGTGITPAMASKAYSSAEVLQYFSAAWTYFQQKKTAGTW